MSDRAKPTDRREPGYELLLPVIVHLLPVGQTFPINFESILASELGQLFFFFPCLECSSTINSYAVSFFTVSIQCQIPLDLSLWARPLLFLSCHPRTCLSRTPGLIFFKALTLRGLFSCMCISLSHSRHTALK